MAVFHERWLQRVNATDVAGGIAVTNDAGAAVLLDHLHVIIIETTRRARGKVRTR
jgi:hypothetical protein